MKYGLTEAEYTFLNDNLIALLKTAGARVFIFGSRATGKHQKFSDIDILYSDFENKIPPSTIFQIVTTMEESNFPYKVDLVNEKDLAKSYFENVMKSRIEI